MKPDPKRPTIADIAREAGVSTGAVSYALNGRPGVSETTRQRILTIADEIGWRPNVAARSLSRRTAQAVGLVLARPARQLEVEPFFVQFMAGIQIELSDHGIALLLQVVNDHAAATKVIERWWAERSIDGVILTDLTTPDPRVPVVEHLGVPTVVVGGPHEATTLPSVWTDDVAAVDVVVDYLVALGHRRIARVSGIPSLYHTRNRVTAFKAALARHNLGEPPIISTDYTGEQGARATRELMAMRSRPTAITFDNDVMAIAALGVAREMGIAVPDDLTIVAGDDSPLCTIVHPPLTALQRDVSGFGGHAARALLKVIHGDPDRSFQIPGSRLVVRASSGPPRSDATSGGSAA